jgi:hypothetical protein
MTYPARVPSSLRPAHGSSPLFVPRITDRPDLPGVALGAGLLFLLAAFGAALVHIIEYHLGLGSSGDWRANALSMLAHCPLSGGLVVVVLCTLSALAAVLGQVRALSLQRRRLTRAASPAVIGRSAACTMLPRRPARLLQLLIPLLALQFGLYELADHLWTMGISMRMGGVLMTMPVHGAAPLLPLHVMIAVVSAFLVWRLERRLTVLRAVIARIRRLLGLFGAARRPSRIPLGPALRPLCAWVAPALLSRPPPA